MKIGKQIEFEEEFWDHPCPAKSDKKILKISPMINDGSGLNETS